MKKVVTAIALVSALSMSVAAPAYAGGLKDHPKWRDGSAGYYLGCAIGKALGIEMCAELEPGFGTSDGGGGNSTGGGGR